MNARNEPTDRDAFVAVWMEETAPIALPHCDECGFDELARLKRELGAIPAGSICHSREIRFETPPRHHRLCDAVELMRLARKAQRHAVNACNREVTERETKADEKNDLAIYALCQKYGFTPILGGDPRGYVVKVVFRSDGPSNTWGGAEDGWGVPS